MMGTRAPPLISDEELTSSNSESESFSDSTSSDDDWSIGLRSVVGPRPNKSDYDKHGLFKSTSDYFTTSDEDAREVISVSEMDPLVAQYLSNGNVDEAAISQENIKSSSVSSDSPKKELKIHVPGYSENLATQARNIRSFYGRLLQNYTDYRLDDVSKKCQEFTLCTRSEVEIAVNVFYEKAVSDESHAKPIASLCKKMEVHKIHDITLFRETMLSYCQKKFLQIKGEVNVIEEVSLGMFTDCNDLTFELQNEGHYENWLEWTRVEDKMRCHMVFLGELYNVGELPIKVILYRMVKMFETKGSRHLDLLSIEGLYELLRTVGPKLDNELVVAPADVVSQYQHTIDNLQSLCKDVGYPPRVRERIRDILKLKDKNWKSAKKPTDREAERAAMMKTVKRAPRQSPVQAGAAVQTPATSANRSGTALGAGVVQSTAKSAGAVRSGSTKANGGGKSSNLTVGAAALPSDKTSPPCVKTSRQPLVVKPESSQQSKYSSHDKLNRKILDNLSKGWQNVTDGDIGGAINIYKECLLLFNLLSSPHDQMDATLVCLYVLLTEHGPLLTEAESIYQAISKIGHKTMPFVDYIHLKHLSRGCEDFKKTLTHFTRLNRSVEQSWNAIYYPLSKRLLEQSDRDTMREWLQKFVTSLHHAYKDTFQKCVFEGCFTPGLFIVHYEEFDIADTYEALECSEKCKQYYHHKCFKSLRKWNIDEQCLTPDCAGKIIRLYEKGIVKRESKAPMDPKKGKERAGAQPPPHSPRTKKKGGKKRLDSSSGGRDQSSRDSVSLEVPAPSSSPPPPPPSPTPPPTPSPEPGYTGDDIVDMFGTMLIYLEEYPKLHLTTVVMEMNSLYPWVRVDIFNEFLDIGVQSLSVNQKGELDLRHGTDKEKEKRKDKDITLLIEHYKNAPIEVLKQKLDNKDKEKSAEQDRTKPSERKKHPSCEKNDKQYKRHAKTSGTKTNGKDNNTTSPTETDRVHTPDAPVKHRTLSGSLNPGAATFRPPAQTTHNGFDQMYRGGHYPLQNDLRKETKTEHDDDDAGYVPFKTSTIPPAPHIRSHYKPLNWRTNQQVFQFGGHPTTPHPPSPTDHLPAGADPHPTIHDAIYTRAAAQLAGSREGDVPPVNVGAPIRPTPEQASYAERKNLLERISELETLLNDHTKYKKEADHLKTQLVDQIDCYAKLKSKAKQYKQEAKNAQESLDGHTKLENDYEKLHKQIEEERKNWLSERTGKSVESKKLIVNMKIEIEEANKRKSDLESKNIALTRENGELGERVQKLENDLYSRDQAIMKLKSETLEVTQRYRSIQQQHVLERFNTAQLRLRIAYANCEAQIRERSLQHSPELYYLPSWQICQDDVRCKIDENNFRYQEYVASLHMSQDLEVKFEEEPLCPTMENALHVLPLQRFDDILLGRAAPPLPTGQPLNPQIDSELNVLADLMRDSTSFMAPPDTSSLIPTFPNTSLITASTPALTSINTHFQFTDQHVLPTNTATRPPSSGSSNGRPPSKPLDLADFMKMPAAHFEITDNVVPILTQTRQPAAAAPIDAIPGFVIPNVSDSCSPTPSGGRPVESPRPAVKGRGRARATRKGESTVPLGGVDVSSKLDPPSKSPVHSPAPSNPANAMKHAGPNKGAALKNRIKTNFPHLSEKEIIMYLKRVKEDTDSQRVRVTPAIALQLVSDLVKLDYPSTTPNTGDTPPSPENTCVICHEALNLQTVSTLGCGHHFHKACVDQWFATQNHTCPTCRSHEPPLDMFPPLRR